MSQLLVGTAALRLPLVDLVARQLTIKMVAVVVAQVMEPAVPEDIMRRMDLQQRQIRVAVVVAPGKMLQMGAPAGQV